MNSYLGYFQLAALATFTALVVGRAVALRRAYGIKVFTLASGKKGLPRLAEILVFPFLFAWMAEVVLYALEAPYRLFPYPLSLKLVDSDLLRWLGAALIVIAIGIFLAALIAFGKSWRIGIDERSPGQLVRRGIFAISRNPIFVSLDLYFLGTFLINGTLVFLLFAAVVMAGVHYQILQEERFLRRQYGPAYDAYRRATRRYLGWSRLPRSA